MSRRGFPISCWGSVCVEVSMRGVVDLELVV